MVNGILAYLPCDIVTCPLHPPEHVGCYVLSYGMNVPKRKTVRLILNLLKMTENSAPHNTFSYATHSNVHPPSADQSIQCRAKNFTQCKAYSEQHTYYLADQVCASLVQCFYRRVDSPKRNMNQHFLSSCFSAVRPEKKTACQLSPFAQGTSVTEKQ